MLALVQFQLSLFPWRPISLYDAMGPKGKAKRTPAHLLKSAAKYCDWRADHYRHAASDRFNPDRVAYLDAQQLLADLIYRQTRPALELPQLVAPSPAPSRFELQLAKKSRAALADELLAVSPRHTDRRLLMHLPPKKLANILARVYADRAHERSATDAA